MKTRLLFCFVSFALLLTSLKSWGVTYTWTGSAGTLWSTPGNWAGGIAPTSTIDVLIPTGTTNLPTVDVASTCKSVTIGGSGSVTLTLSATLTLTGGLKIDDGCILTLAGAGQVSTGAASLVGTSAASTGGASLTVNATATISFGANLTVEPGCTLINNGNISTTNVINLTTSSVFTNSSTGIITLPAITSALNFADATTTTNAGQIIAGSKSVVSTGVSGTFTNSSTGIITLSDAAFNLADGSTTNNSGQIIANTTAIQSIINTGVSGTLNNNSGGTITLNASKIIIDNGTSLVNSGNIAANSGSTVLVNGNNATLFSSINNSSSAANFTLDASTLTLDFGCTLTNAGTIAANNGATIKLNSQAASAFAAAITCSSGANLTFDSSTLTLSNGCTLTNAGTITANNSIVTINGNTTTLFSVLTNNNIFNTYGTTFTIDGGSTFKNNGSFTAATCTFKLTGAGGTNITNTGTYQDIATTYTLPGNASHISNTNGTFKLGAASSITPSGANTYVRNDPPGVFTLQSNFSGSAAIGKLSSTSSCTGLFNVERYVTANRSYRLFTSPTYDAIVSSNNVYTLKYLGNTAYVTGYSGTGAGFDKAGNPSIYLYRQDVPVSNATFTSGNFRGVNSFTSGVSYSVSPDGGPYYMSPATGFLFFFRGDRSSGTLANETSTTFAPTAATFTVNGQLNQGNIAVKNWYGAADLRSVITGYTLTGNPYASSINWDTFNGANGTTGITGTNIFPTIYVFNPSNKQYGAYMTNNNSALRVGVNGATNVIASGEGFFVQADPLASGAANLTFTESAKIPLSQATGANLMMGVPQGAYDVRQILRMKLAIDTLDYDDIAIAFNSGSSPKYKNMEDSQYLAGLSAPEGLASFSADSVPVPLSINFLPLPKKAQQVIRLKIAATNSGRLTLQKTQLDSLPKIYELWLVDGYKKDSLDLRNNDKYAFDINKADTASYGDNRFSIVVRQSKALGIHLLDFKAVKSQDGVPVSWKTENEENYTNFTVERSTDNGVTFDVLGGFASNSQGVYNFTDKNPVNTVDIYRLKIEDLNGAISYSKAIAIVYDPSKVVAASTKVNVYPNPASGMVNVAIIQQGFTNTNLSGIQSNNQTATLASAPTPSYGIKIISVTGSVIKTATSATATWQDNVSDLLPGTYFIQVVNNNDKSVIGKSSFVKL